MPERPDLCALHHLSVQARTPSRLIALSAISDCRNHTSRLATDSAFSWMNSRRGSTTSPISRVKISSATSACVDLDAGAASGWRDRAWFPTAARRSSRPAPCSARSRGPCGRRRTPPRAGRTGAPTDDRRARSAGARRRPRSSSPSAVGCARAALMRHQPRRLRRRRRPARPPACASLRASAEPRNAASTT